LTNSEAAVLKYLLPFLEHPWLIADSQENNAYNCQFEFSFAEGTIGESLL
jgi:hypothetical protein